MSEASFRDIGGRHRKRSAKNETSDSNGLFGLGGMCPGGGTD